jgi:hypothetical protein
MPASSPKPRKSIRIPPGQAKKYADAVAMLTAFYTPLAGVWTQLTPAQQDGVLTHSPLLAGILAFAAQFERKERR